MNARQKMTREEALRLVALGVRGPKRPDVPDGDLGLDAQTVSGIIQAIPLGCCPRWMVDRPRNPRTARLECTVAEARQLAGLMLGERGRVLSESLLEYFEAVDRGYHSLFPPPEAAGERHCVPGRPETGEGMGRDR